MTKPVKPVNSPPMYWWFTLINDFACFPIRKRKGFNISRNVFFSTVLLVDSGCKWASSWLSLCITHLPHQLPCRRQSKWAPIRWCPYMMRERQIELLLYMYRANHSAGINHTSSCLLSTVLGLLELRPMEVESSVLRQVHYSLHMNTYETDCCNAL